MVGFDLLAYQVNQQQWRNETIIYLVLALLFQPLMTISLGQEIWAVVDADVAISLVVSVVKK